MSATAPSPTAASTPCPLQLLRGPLYEEIRARMYDNALGTAWWSACKTSLISANSEKLATSLVENSRVAARISTSSEHMERLTETLLEITAGVAEVVRV